MKYNEYENNITVSKITAGSIVYLEMPVYRHIQEMEEAMDDRAKQGAGEDTKNFRTSPDYNGGTLSYREHPMPLWYMKTKHSIYYVLGVIEILLAFRFLFRLLGANPRSGFVAFIYAITGILTAPFKGIFNSLVTEGLSARAVFEPSTVIALIVYAIIAWGLVRLIRIKAARDGH